MVINTGKTKSMLVTTQQRRHHLPDQKHKVEVNGQVLEQVESERLLGVIVDQNLNWRDHVNKVYKKITTNLALLRRIKRYLPYWSRIMFDIAYIVPHVDFCVTVWGSCSDITSLAKLQKQAARIILDCDFTTPSSDMFQKLRWMPIKDWVEYRKANTVYKALNMKTPDYITNMFNSIQGVHSRSTRQSKNGDLYVPPRAKLNVFRNSLCYSGACLWNNLPTDLRNVPSVSMFKEHYFKRYFDN
jgi:hypothetical protein